MSSMKCAIFLFFYLHDNFKELRLVCEQNKSRDRWVDIFAPTQLII